MTAPRTPPSRRPARARSTNASSTPVSTGLARPSRSALASFSFRNVCCFYFVCGWWRLEDTPDLLNHNNITKPPPLPLDPKHNKNRGHVLRRRPDRVGRIRRQELSRRYHLCRAERYHQVGVLGGVGGGEAQEEGGRGGRRHPSKMLIYPNLATTPENTNQHSDCQVPPGKFFDGTNVVTCPGE